MASAFSPGNRLPGSGKSTLTERSVVPPALTVDGAGMPDPWAEARCDGQPAKTATATIAAVPAPAISLADLTMRSSHSNERERGLLDHAAHEAAAVPIRFARLDLTPRIGATRLQDELSRFRRGDRF